MLYGLDALVLDNFSHSVNSSLALSSCPVADLGFFKQISDFVATSVPWISYPQASSALGWGFSLAGRGSALKQGVNQSGRGYSSYCVHGQWPHPMWNPYVTSFSWFFCSYFALLGRGHIFPAFSPPMCGKFNRVGLQHACRATSLQDGQFHHVGPCELRPVHALFICPRLSSCSIYSLGLIHSSLGQMLFLISFVRPYLPFLNAQRRWHQHCAILISVWVLCLLCPSWVVSQIFWLYMCVWKYPDQKIK